MSIDFASIKAEHRLSAIIGQSMKLRRAGREFVGCCPFHNEKTASFTVNDDKGFAHCFGCGWHGDAVDFIAAVEGGSLKDAAARITGGDIPTAPRLAAPERDCDTVGLARSIWRQSLPIEGTPAAQYLWQRGITAKLPPSLRFARLRYPGGAILPALVAAIIAPGRTLAGVQRIFLTEDGLKASVPNPKLSLGRVSGNAIRLGPPAAALVVCEGLEDALSLQQELGRVVWAAAGAAMLSAMRFPDAVQSVVIARDNDAAGERESDKAAASYAERGLAVRVMHPRPDFKDFNEQLLDGRDAA